MEERDSDQILIITGTLEKSIQGRVERGLSDELVDKAVSSVSVSILKRNMERFFAQLREVLGAWADKIGPFEVSEVEISAQITGEGQVCLLGSGVKVETQGGIKLVLRRAVK